MKTTELLNDKEAVKLAVAFKEMAKEYKTTIPEMVAEGKRITELIQSNRTDSIVSTLIIQNLIERHEPDPQRREELKTFIDNLNIEGLGKAFSALVLAFFFADKGILTEE